MVTTITGELQVDGVIPGGVNIPIPVVAEAFTTMDPETFEEAFGIGRPGHVDEIVVFCKIGKRSLSAARFLISQGYTNVKSYSGLDDWKANQK